MSAYELAQLNIAAMKAPLDSPVMAGFVENIERMNTLAEQSDGFRWRLQDDNGDATQIRDFGAEVVVNMSVWRDIESLKNYAFKTAHTDVLKRRREWFDKMEQAHAVLWWVPKGHRPTVAEAAERLTHLREFGTSAFAFTFREPFDAKGEPLRAPAVLTTIS